LAYVKLLVQGTAKWLHRSSVLSGIISDVKIIVVSRVTEVKLKKIYVHAASPITLVLDQSLRPVRS